MKGAGRHRMVGGKFKTRGDMGPRPRQRSGFTAHGSSDNGMTPGTGIPLPDTMGNGIPNNTVVRSFAKPTNLSLSAGLLVNSPLETIMLAREMYDNDPISGAVVDTIVGVPFGNFSLSGMPDKDHLKPYLSGMDRIRVKSLLPTLAASYLVDGAFLGTAIFDDKDKCFSAMMPQDLIHAEITPVPFFGATPVIDIHIPPEAARMMHIGLKDPRMQAYLKFMPEDFRKGGLVKLQPENTLYIPRRGLSHQPLGISLFRKIMITYILEKSLARGTTEMAYRRQRPVLHIVAGDENWDPSVEEMQELSGLFLDADLDPLGAVVTTRAGVMPQEIGGAGDFWKWTDNIDVLTSIKLKGLGMPDGLLGGDMSLDSVSATLTIFINMIRAFRDYITRSVFYEKIFPYTAIVNNHRRALMGDFEETSLRRTMLGEDRSFHYTNNYVERAQDSDVDIGDYLTPTISWHNSIRPEGDKDYIDMLMLLQQAGVPIPIRMMASAGGQDIGDIINGAQDDVEMQAKLAVYKQAIQQAGGVTGQEQQDGGGDDQGGGEYGNYDPHKALAPFRRKSILQRFDRDDKFQPRNSINGHSYHTTQRFRNDTGEKQNRIVAAANASVAQRMNWLMHDKHEPKKTTHLIKRYGLQYQGAPEGGF